MINTHKKLVENILSQKTSKEELYEKLKEKGYKGDIESLIPDLLYATVNSDAYMYLANKVDNIDEELTEEEYFRILIYEMNINY